MTIDDYLRALGLPSGGAVRASLGLASNAVNVDRFAAFAEEFVDLPDVPDDLPPRTRCQTGPATAVHLQPRNPTTRRFLSLPLALAGVTLLASCGGSGRVTVAQLAERQDAFAGKRVETEGVVRQELDPDATGYFVLSDAAGDLVGLKPAARARAYVGQPVDVQGRFEVESGFGRVIFIASIRRQR